jgi:hypothetical protein
MAELGSKAYVWHYPRLIFRGHGKNARDHINKLDTKNVALLPPTMLAVVVVVAVAGGRP